MGGGGVPRFEESPWPFLTPMASRFPNTERPSELESVIKTGDSRSVAPAASMTMIVARLRSKCSVNPFFDDFLNLFVFQHFMSHQTVSNRCDG